MIKKIIFSSFVLFSMFLFCAGAMAAKNNSIESIDRVAAVVNEGVITEHQLLTQMQRIRKQMQAANNPVPSNKVLRRQVLQQMINQKLQMQVAKRVGIKASAEEVNDSIKQLAAHNRETINQLYKKMRQQGWTKAEFRKEIESEIMIQKLQGRQAAPHISLSKQEIDDFVQNTTDNPQEMAKYHLANILIAIPATPTTAQVDNARQVAQSVIKKLKAGAKFFQVAQSQSNGKEALQGGDLGWRRLPELPEAFAKRVTSMRVGDIAGPIQTPNGFHVIKLLGKRGGLINSHEPEYDIQLIFMKKKKGEIQNNVIEETLDGFKKQIEAGDKTFSQLARRYSQDSRTAKNGGYLGWVKKRELQKDLRPVVVELKAGEVSSPIMTPKGWYLIRLEAEKTQVKTSESQRKEIEQLIYQRKMSEEVDAFITKLRSESYIKVIN